MTKNLHILRTKRVFEVTLKALLIICKRLSVTKNRRRNESASLPPETTSISIWLELLLFLLLFLSLFSYVFLKNGHEKRLKYLLTVSFFIQSYLSLISFGIKCSKIKALNQIWFFIPKYIRTCEELNNIRFSLMFSQSQI